MSSYNNLSSVSKTLANHIWNGIKDDRQISFIIKSPEQIIHLSPKDAQPKLPQISIYLYNVTELSRMRNQPQNPQKPPTLLHLNLHYLITPLTQIPENDQMVLGKIMQLFAQTPVLRGSDLQGNLKEDGEDLRITLDALEVDYLNKLWTMLSTPHKLAVSYTVHPIRIESTIKPAEPSKPERTPAIIKKDLLPAVKKTTIKA